MEAEQKSTSEMSMNNEDTVIEVTDENEIQNSEPTEVQLQAHEKDKNEHYLLKYTYDSIKDQTSPPNCGEIVDDEVFVQKSPKGNTVLHIAALYGNDNWVEKVFRRALFLLRAKNANGDTALHVAARAGQISILKKLLASLLHNLPHPYSENPKEALYEILAKNKQGNTFFHEALLNGHQDVMNILGSQELQMEAGFRELVERAALFWTNNEEKSVVVLAIEKGYKDIVDDALNKLISQHSALDRLIENHQELAEMIEAKLPLFEQDQARGMIENHEELAQLIPYGPHYVPSGESPLIAAILKLDQDILKKILKEKNEWIHLWDNKGRTALHCAASIGFKTGVRELLKISISCNMERDNDGYFPLHLASASGDAEVVRILLEHCPNPREILDNYGRNIVHIAAQMGKLNVVRYILQDENLGLVNMINDKDASGNTPLHLATLHCRLKIVHALTWDKRVDLNSVNGKNQTALDADMQFSQENLSFCQLLIRMALISAGIQYGERGSHPIKVIPPPAPYPTFNHKASTIDKYKDMFNTLILISTLITTVTFAAGFTLPGGANSSNPGQGMAVMLYHVWFKLFIFCNTVSMYGAISVTITLIWAQLGDATLAAFALKVTGPVIGVTLATLSVAFMAGVHLVISDLSWLATALLVLCVISILMLLLLYTILWFPLSSSKPVMRWLSYYPFLFLAWLVDKQDETEEKKNKRRLC